MEYISRLYDGWRDLMDNKSDQRTTNWFLMESPLPTIVICLTYAYFVKVLGPKLMENRKPFKLRKVLIVYNFIQVLFSLWLFYSAAFSGWLVGYNYRCQPVDNSKSAIAMRMAEGCWWYFFSKFTEFFDTFFFVMRKRYDQVSTLHVIHHGIMPFSVWWGVKFTPGGHSSFFGFINTGVHVVMYTYYMLAAMGPEVQKYLWWKKYLTVLQIVQFVAIMVHAFQLFFWNPCQYPIAFAWWIGLHAVMFFFLFRNFFKQAYQKKKERAESRLIESQEVNNNTSVAEKEDNNKSKTPLYHSMGRLEDSYELRNRVFVGSKN